MIFELNALWLTVKNIIFQGRLKAKGKDSYAKQKKIKEKGNFTSFLYL